MIRVRLESPRGETVHTRHIFEFDPMPEIIRWGSRHFVNVGSQGGAVVYREALLYAIPNYDEDQGTAQQWQTGGDRGD